MSEITRNLDFVKTKASFISKLSNLSKAVADDQSPTPAYLYQEISDITFESGSHCQDLLNFLNDTLQSHSPHVKLKVLKLMLHVVKHGHPDFRENLRKQAQGIEEATKYGGRPDVEYGMTLYHAVCQAAQAVLQELYNEPSSVENSRPQPLLGLGNVVSGSSAGFGNTPTKPKSFLSSVKELAEKVLQPAEAERKWTEQESTYRPAQLRVEESCTHLHRQVKGKNVHHQPGVAGGGWSEPDETALRLKPASVQSLDGSSTSGPRDRLELAEDMKPEEDLVKDIVNSNLQPLTIKAFIKSCSFLNCESILRDLSARLTTRDATVVTNCLLLLEALLRMDLLPVETIQEASSNQLNTLKNDNVKAKKILLIMQALGDSG